MGMSDEGFDLGRRHPPDGAGMPGLSMQER